MQTRSRQVALLLFDEVELLDVAGPLSVLSTAGRHWNWRPFKVHAVAERPGNVTTRSQLSIVADTALADRPAPEIVLVPGGYGARRALAHEPVLTWLAAACAGAELVAAIGSGSLLLAKAGVATKRRLAAGEDLARELLDLDASLVLGESGVVEDEQLISASDSGHGLELALRLVARVLGAKLANGAAQSLGIPWLAPELTKVGLDPRRP